MLANMANLTQVAATPRYVSIRISRLSLFPGAQPATLILADLPWNQCLAWYALSCIGGACILQFLNRGSTREKYGIRGGSCGDFCTSWCCICCALVQEEKESIVRTTGMDPKTEKPYVSPGQMTYP
jgi:Cys-rich protein (TIGR01571 family)